MSDGAFDCVGQSDNAALPLVSVVVLSYNRCQNLLELLDALSRQDYPRFEIIIVDNGSQDGTIEAVERLHPEVRLIKSPENLGSAAHGLGFANARGEFILEIDDDGLPVTRHWISHIVERFQSNPRLAVVACTIRMRDTGLIAHDSPQYVPEDRVDGGFPSAAHNGTGVGFRAAALRQVGYYPLHFFLSWIELHQCTRLIQAGWEVRCFPAIEVWHCRPSGGVTRPATYDGLKNYFWYVWTFYPWPQCLGETLHFIGSRLKAVLTGHLPLGLLVRAITHAIFGWVGLSNKRQPVSKSTLDYLRHIRRHGNDHGLILTHRPFVS